MYKMIVTIIIGLIISTFYGLVEEANAETIIFGIQRANSSIIVKKKIPIQKPFHHHQRHGKYIKRFGYGSRGYCGPYWSRHCKHTRRKHSRMHRKWHKRWDQYQYDTYHYHREHKYFHRFELTR